MAKIFRNILSGFLISTLLLSIIGVNIKHHVCEITGQHEVYLIESDCSCHGSCEAEHNQSNENCTYDHQYECCDDISDLISLDLETILSKKDTKYNCAIKITNKVHFNQQAIKAKKPHKDYFNRKPLNFEQDKLVKLIPQKISTQSDDDLIS